MRARPKWVGVVLLGAALGGCVPVYIPPDEGTATLLARPPDALLSSGLMEILIYPRGCPIGDDDQPLRVARLHGGPGGGPRSLEVVGDELIVLQVHFLHGNVSCRAQMEVALESGRRYELRTDLKRIERNWNDPLEEYVCAFMIVGVRSTGMVKPGGDGKPQC